MNHNLSIHEVEQIYENIKSKNFSLDLTRGKPSSEQLDLSIKLDQCLKDQHTHEGIDTRNYGEVLGLGDMRQLGAEMLGCRKEMVIAGGNSSLTLMANYLSSLFFHGSGAGPWSTKVRNSFLCPVPGYDRHFKLSEEFSINMIPVGLTGRGPDIKLMKSIALDDPSLKGIWCVPKHSNPTGETYDLDSIEAILDLAESNKEFRIFWDNAYAVHDFKESLDLPNIFDLAQKRGLEDCLIAFASTSKITYAGSGVGFIAMSNTNQQRFLKHYSSMVIGPDKINQLRHINFFKDLVGLNDFMEQHAEIVRPKFQTVENWLSKQNFGSWTKPTGGYFVTYKSEPGLAKEIIRLADLAGLKLTPAGATFPYGVDPKDEIIRIAPTACSAEDLEKAMEIFNICVALATLKQAS